MSSTELPVSSVPAAFDNGHLFSPDQDSSLLDQARPGDRFGPLPSAPLGSGAIFREWSDAAGTATPNFLGLRVGDTITLQWPGQVIDGCTVLETCRYGARVRYPMPSGTRVSHAEMYVNRRNLDGHWY